MLGTAPLNPQLFVFTRELVDPCLKLLTLYIPAGNNGLGARTSTNNAQAG